MSNNVMISFLGENKPNLISDVTTYLTEQGGEFSGVTFATLGRVCELTMVYQMDKGEGVNSIKEGLTDLKSAKNGEFTVNIALIKNHIPRKHNKRDIEIFKILTRDIEEKLFKYE